MMNLYFGSSAEKHCRPMFRFAKIKIAGAVLQKISTLFVLIIINASALAWLNKEKRTNWH